MAGTASTTTTSGTGAGFANIAAGIGSALGGVSSIIGAVKGNPTAPVVLNTPSVDASSVAAQSAVGSLDSLLANSATLQKLSSGIGSSAASGATDFLKKYGTWILLGVGAVVLLTFLKRK
jgi:hypothetical protein